jgi:polysaccharide pyruvyl transferase WcaK-like protein
LWRLLLSRAATITVREKRSFAVVTTSVGYEKALLYHDFAYDVLRTIPKNVSEQKPYLLINVNPYIRSEETKRKIVLYVAQYPTVQPIFFSAEAGVDDVFFDELLVALPSLQRYDWTGKSMQEICDFFCCCACGIAARLHVLLLLRWAKVPFEALVYQEKISTFLEACSDE